MMQIENGLSQSLNTVTVSNLFNVRKNVQISLLYVTYVITRGNIM